VRFGGKLGKSQLHTMNIALSKYNLNALKAVSAYAPYISKLYKNTSTKPNVADAFDGSNIMDHDQADSKLVSYLVTSPVLRPMEARSCELDHAIGWKTGSSQI
jgi:hypothetical protein